MYFTISSCHVSLMYVCTFSADDTFIPEGVGIGMLLLLVMSIVVVIVVVVAVKWRAARNQKRKIRGNLHCNNIYCGVETRHGGEKLTCKC